jgi:hypothetical protein
MMSTRCARNLICWNVVARVGLHGAVHADHLLAEPAIDGGVALLQGALGRTNDLGRRDVAPGGDQSVDGTRLFGGQVEGTLLSGCDDIVILTFL